MTWELLGAFRVEGKKSEWGTSDGEMAFHGVGSAFSRMRYCHIFVFS